MAWLFLLVIALPTNHGAVGEEEDRFVAIRAGTIITVSGEEIENGVIVIRNGKIEAVGERVEIPWGAEVIDARHLTVMPGMINARTKLGIPMFRRTGTRTNLRAIDGLHTDEDTFKFQLDAGFTTIAIYPDGSGFPGQASVVRPLSGSRDEIVIDPEAYVRIPFTRPDREKRTVLSTFKRAKGEIDKVENARKKWEEQQKKKAEEEEQKKKKEENDKEPKPESSSFEEKPKVEATKEKKEETFTPPSINPTLAPLVDLLQKKEGARALIELTQAAGYVHLQEILEEFPFDHIYMIKNRRESSAGRFPRNDVNAGLIADRMGKEKPKLLLLPEINTIPYTSDRINLPLQFKNAGCEISFLPIDDSKTGFIHFREKVAEVVKYGFPRREALKAITIHPAKILGLDQRLGTIEAERDANLIFLDGDPLDSTSRVLKVMIEGLVVSESDRNG